MTSQVPASFPMSQQDHAFNFSFTAFCLVRAEDIRTNPLLKLASEKYWKYCVMCWSFFFFLCQPIVNSTKLKNELWNFCFRDIWGLGTSCIVYCSHTNACIRGSSKDQDYWKYCTATTPAVQERVCTAVSEPCSLVMEGLKLTRDEGCPMTSLSWPLLPEKTPFVQESPPYLQ